MHLDSIGGYRIIARLGRGGMADVFLAVRDGAFGFNKLVVIKCLRADLREDADAGRYRTLLLDEARVAARLRHPNIVPTFEVGEHDGQPYLAMEYLEGQPVSQVLMRAQRRDLEIPLELSLRVVADALSALEYAHQLTDYDGAPLGIVHRDVSPQNIFWTYAGEVKLVDFGVAKFAFGQDHTQTGMLKGKLGYMAPEQARGEDVDPRADVFAAGVVLWELVTGRRLVGGKSQAAQLHRLLFDLLPPLHAVKPDVDPAIARICDRALERDPDRRFVSADAMRAEIECVLGTGGPRREELAAFIEPMFADDRLVVAEQIRAAMTGAQRQSLLTLADAEPSASYLELEVVRAATVAARAPAAEVSPAPAEPGPSGARRPKLGMLAAVLAGAAAIVATVAFFSSQPRPAASAATVTLAQPPPAVDLEAAPAASEPVLRLCGSNTVGAELAPALVEAFLRDRGATAIHHVAGPSEHLRIVGTLAGKEVVVDLVAAGTATGFAGLVAGSCDLGMASRTINASEIEAAERVGLGDLRSPATEHVIALDGIAVLVHRNNPLRALDRDTLRAVFTGAVTDWSQLGGAPGPIHVLARDHNSGTYDTFKSLVLGRSQLRAGTRRFDHNDALADAVAGDPGAIGFVGLAYIRSAKALSIGDRGGAPPMLPTTFTVTTEGYLLSRRLFFYSPPRPRSPLVAELVSFATSPQGQEVVRQAGFVNLDVFPSEPASCDARCPRKYAELVAGARRLSVDFRFRYGSDELDSRAAGDLDRVLHFLARRPEAEILLLGFSDRTGDATYNVRLSRHRAITIARELQARGVRATTIEGFGAAMPLSIGTTAVDRERNRRVEIWVR